MALGRLAFDGGTTPLSVAFLGHYYLLLPWEQFVFVWDFTYFRAVLISMLFLGCLFSHMAFGNVGSTKYIPISLAALLFFIYPPVVAILNHAIS